MTKILRVSEPNILQLLTIEKEEYQIINSNIEIDKHNLAVYFKLKDYETKTKTKTKTNTNDFFEKFINSIDNNNELDNYQSLKNFIINNKKKTTIKKTFEVINYKFDLQCEYYDYNKDIVLNYEYNFFNNIDNLIRSIEDFNRYLTDVNEQTDLKTYCDELIKTNDELDYYYSSNKKIVILLNKQFLYSISLEDNIYCYKCVTNRNKFKKNINYITYFNILFNDAYQEYTSAPADSSDKYIYRITIMKGSKVLFYEKYIIISSNSYVFFNDNDGDKYIDKSNNISLSYDIYSNQEKFRSIDVIIRNNIYSIKNKNISNYIIENRSSVNDLVIMCPLKIEKNELKISYPDFDVRFEKLIIDDDPTIKNFFLNDKTFRNYKKIDKNSKISFFKKTNDQSPKFIAVLHPNFEDIISDSNNDQDLYNNFYWYYYNIYKCFHNNLLDNINKQLCLFPICVPLKYEEKIYRYLVTIFFYLNIEFNINPKIFFHEEDKFQLFKETIQYYNSNCLNVQKRKLGFNNDSCYMDCFFYMLFNTKNKFIEEFILKAPIILHEDKDNRNELYKMGKEIQKKLIEIYNLFNNKYSQETTCDKLGIRSLLQKYKCLYDGDEYETFNNDPNKSVAENILIKTPIIKKNEFEYKEQTIYKLFKILYLIFDIPNFISKINDDTNELLINNFHIDIILNHVNYVNIINHNLTIKIPIIYINFENNKIIIDPIKIIEINKNKLYLNSILIHNPSRRNSTNGHFVLLYKCNDYWYKYDDQKEENEYIGLFENFNTNPDYTRNIVGLYYTG